VGVQSPSEGKLTEIAKPLPSTLILALHQPITLGNVKYPAFAGANMHSAFRVFKEILYYNWR